MPPPTCEAGALGNVVLLTAEDGPEDTVRPRFDAAGGDPYRLHIFNGIRQPDGSTLLPRLPEDIEWLRAALLEADADLLIIDPLAAYLSQEVNSWNDQHVRHVLARLAQLAEELGIAVIIVMHLNKATNQGAMYRAGGSIAFVAAARSVLLAVPHPADDDLRVLSAVKSNLGPKAHSLVYRILASGQASRVDWRGESPYDAETLLAEQARSGEKKLKVEGAKEFLREVIPSGRRIKEEVIAEGGKAGHRTHTLERAFKALGGLSEKDFGGQAWWRLPANLTESPAIEPVGEVRGPEAANSLLGNEDGSSAEALAIGENGRTHRGEPPTSDLALMESAHE